MINCTACGKEANPVFMCDEQTEGEYCADCFEKETGCTDEAHGEGCCTLVSYDEEEQ